MKKSILFIVIVIFANSGYAINTSPCDTAKKIVVKTKPKIKKKKNKTTTSSVASTTAVEQPVKHKPNPMPIAPFYKEGQAAMIAFIKKNIVVPQEVKTKNEIFTVNVAFVVAADGKLKDIHVVKSVGMGCDEEAERVVRLMPDWNPGKVGRVAYDMQYAISIEFK